MNTPAPNTSEPETLLFGYGETELGQIVVAETGRGVAEPGPSPCHGRN